jgi:Uma2 family endonuclease
MRVGGRMRRASVDYSDFRQNCVLVRKRPAMTSLEYFNTPESLLPTELAFGTLQVRDSPSSSHQGAVGSFFVALREHVRTRSLGDVWVAPLDVVLDEAKALIVQPDLFYVSQDRADIVQRRVYGAPDLVVEVLSPRPRVGDFDQRLETRTPTTVAWHDRATAPTETAATWRALTMQAF